MADFDARLQALFAADLPPSGIHAFRRKSLPR